MKQEQLQPPASREAEAEGGTTGIAPLVSAPTPSWFDCELFCIGDYAGVGGRRCGWRGKLAETRWDPTRRVRPCPRCGDATLMELDFAQDRDRLER
jgi:hypothetical protein